MPGCWADALDHENRVRSLGLLKSSDCSLRFTCAKGQARSRQAAEAGRSESVGGAGTRRRADVQPGPLVNDLADANLVQHRTSHLKT